MCPVAVVIGILFFETSTFSVGQGDRTYLADFKAKQVRPVHHGLVRATPAVIMTPPQLAYNRLRAPASFSSSLCVSATARASCAESASNNPLRKDLTA